MSLNAHNSSPLVGILSTLRRAAAGLVIGCLAATVLAGPRVVPAMVPVADPFDPEVVLPSRVDASLHRTFAAVERAVAAVDDNRKTAARRALRAASAGFARSHKAVMHQVQAVADPEAEDESTAGPDSALAALNVEQISVGVLASLFDGVRSRGIVRRIDAALRSAQTHRAELLTTITGLDPEEAGAPYVEFLVDTAPQYTDEVAAIQEALSDDKLTRPARGALRAALARSEQAEAVVLTAVGPPD